MNLVEFKEKSQLRDVVILDTRPAEVFETGFIPGSLNIGFNGQYAVRVGTLLELHSPLLLVCEPGKEQEACMRLARIGYENVLGYLEGGFSSWQAGYLEEDEVDSLQPELLEDFLRQHPDVVILDVRKEGEFADAHLTGATLVPLEQLPAKRHDFEPTKQYLVYCGGAYRSMIAVSLLKIFGIDKFTNVHGGFEVIRENSKLALEVGARNTQN